MNNFPFIPVNKRALSFRKPIYGIGINDADYKTQPRINGKCIICPIYTLWRNMIKRCYCKEFQKKMITYHGCSVCPDWIYFSKFRIWVLKQDWEGNQLDKDLLFSGNKLYSPETCLFVSKNINVLLTSRVALRGALPIGVCLSTEKDKYVSSCRVSGKDSYIGRFTTQEQAHIAYLNFKSNHVMEIAMQQTDRMLSAALFRISGEIARGEYYDQ